MPNRLSGIKESRRYGSTNLDETSRLCITVPEAASMMGICRNFAYELVREGKLPSIRLGKRILIPRIALEEMLKQGVKFEGAH